MSAEKFFQVSSSSSSCIIIIIIIVMIVGIVKSSNVETLAKNIANKG